jgi:hypothetical protein
MPRQENTKKIVSITIWIMHLLLQLKLFTTTLHNILCFSIAFNIFVLGFTTGELRSRSAEPRPVVPRHDPDRLHPGRGRPRPSCSKAVASRALAAAGCTKAVARRALAAPSPWLAEPPQSTHEVH